MITLQKKEFDNQRSISLIEIFPKTKLQGFFFQKIKLLNKTVLMVYEVKKKYVRHF